MSASIQALVVYQMLQIGEILDDVEKDDTIRVVVLKGARNRAFVSGADISKFGAQSRNAAEVTESNRITGLARQKLASTELLKDEEERDFTLANRAVQACFDRADYHEGRTAFMEKRKPVFKGK